MYINYYINNNIIINIIKIYLYLLMVKSILKKKELETGLKRKLTFYEIAHKIVTGSNKNKNFVDYKALNERNNIYIILN